MRFAHYEFWWAEKWGNNFCCVVVVWRFQVGQPWMLYKWTLRGWEIHTGRSPTRISIIWFVGYPLVCPYRGYTILWYNYTVWLTTVRTNQRCKGKKEMPSWNLDPPVEIVHLWEFLVQTWLETQLSLVRANQLRKVGFYWGRWTCTPVVVSQYAHLETDAGRLSP